MIFDMDLSELEVGDHLIMTVEVIRIVREKDKTIVKFRNTIVPTEATFTGDPTFEVSSHRIKFI